MVASKCLLNLNHQSFTFFRWVVFARGFQIPPPCSFLVDDPYVVSLLFSPRLSIVEGPGGPLYVYECERFILVILSLVPFRVSSKQQTQNRRCSSHQQWILHVGVLLPLIWCFCEIAFQHLVYAPYWQRANPWGDDEFWELCVMQSLSLPLINTVVRVPLPRQAQPTPCHQLEPSNRAIIKCRLPVGIWPNESCGTLISPGHSADAKTPLTEWIGRWSCRRVWRLLCGQMYHRPRRTAVEPLILLPHMNQPVC